MKHQRRVPLHAILAASAASLLLAGCGGSGSPSGNVTVTVTPTVTAGGKGTSGKPAAPTPPTSDDKGRAFDFGTVVKVSTVAGVPVIKLDRWTWKGLDDAKLAKQGVPVGAFKGPVPYENQNDKLFYTLPVRAGARILFHHCIAADQPLQTKTVTMQDLMGLGAPENTVLVRLDDQGRVVAADNIPGCPG
jgi:hypothetical protein